MNEFQFLDAIRSKYQLKDVGDDCAILPFDSEKDQLLTADMLVEDVDFRIEWTDPRSLGHKALAVSLSDIAAMGGISRWSLLSLAVPEDLWNNGFLDRFYDGWMTLANQFGVELVGGDISRTGDKLVIDCVVGGEVSHTKAFRRSTAKAGDMIFVSGTIGGAAGGLELLEKGLKYDSEISESALRLIRKQLRPEPEVSLANTLQQLGIVTSAIDISDGLSSDLGHICHQSRTGAIIYADQLPLDPDLVFNFPPEKVLEMGLNGGEDLRLLFTAGPDNIRTAQETGSIAIGEMTDNAGCIELVSQNGRIRLDPQGFRHF
jgi:thiamine-monophosphate kinase